MSDVVVVLPFEPVMQIILAFVYRAANSISEMIGVPCACSFCISGAVNGIPGDLMTSSALRINSSECLPSSHFTPF